MAQPIVTQTGPGTYRVEHEGRNAIVYVAGPPEDRWGFWNGQTYQDEPRSRGRIDRSLRAQVEPLLTAPMPSTVVKVLVSVGSPVRRGEAVIVLEAMKMELTLSAPRDARVAAIHCREGDLVQPDRVLIEFR